MTPPQATFTDNTTFFFRDVLETSKAHLPTFLFLWKCSSAAYHPVWSKYFSTRWISIFSLQIVSGITLKPDRSSIGRSLEPSVVATTLTLFVKHSSMTLSFSNGLSFEKGLGLLITPLCFFASGNPITVVSAPSVFLSFSFLEAF